MNFKRWRSFPLQLFVFIVLPLTLLLFVVAFGGLSLHQQAMRSMVGERDQRATRAAAAAISEQLNYRAAAVRNLVLQASVSETPEHALNDLSFMLPDFDGGLAVFDSGGDLLASTNAADIWEARAVYERLSANIQTGDLSNDAPFFPLLTDPASNEELLLVGAAQPGGLIAVGAFSPERLIREALADIFSPDDQASAFVTDRDGHILYQVGSLPLSENGIPKHPGVISALRGESGTTYLSIDGDEHVIAFSPVSAVNWALVIEEPWRAVADPLLRTTELAPLVLVPVIIITLTALWFGVRQIVQPLQALERKATELGWGDFEAISESVGGISEIQRLQNELMHMAQKVKVSQQSLRGYLGAVTAGQEEERRRLARELHDDTIQALIALNQRIQFAQLTADSSKTQSQLTEMQQMAEQTITDLRRLTQALRPIYLEDLGLVPALDMLTKETGRTLQILVDFCTSGTQRRLTSIEELALYRMGQEALSNIARHAHATQATVTLDFANQSTRLMIKDNGCGFTVPESPAEMAITGHFGLLGIQERSELIGAKMEIESSPGNGTRLTISLPDSTNLLQK
ncbi:MAG: HAMP domain-containing protein [Chloroflexi bacterium]|nr:MAG: HAMP domain-containing protein [Chloroflexota bacterium]